MNGLAFYIVINILNVIMQTVKTITTVKCGRVIASIVNAITFALYTAVIYFTAVDGLGIGQKCLIVAICNLVGVFGVKTIEEKMKKDKLMKIEITCYNESVDDIEKELNELNVPHSYIDNIGKHAIFNIYCENKEQIILINKVIKKYDCKYFIAEHKTILD